VIDGLKVVVLQETVHRKTWWMAWKLVTWWVKNGILLWH